MARPSPESSTSPCGRNHCLSPKSVSSTGIGQGTKIRTESQGIERNPESIQHRVIAELKKRKVSIIFDDDDHGEAADVVAIAEEDDHIGVEFWHCKFAWLTSLAHGSRSCMNFAGRHRPAFGGWKSREIFSRISCAANRAAIRARKAHGTRSAPKGLAPNPRKGRRSACAASRFHRPAGLSIAEVSKEQLELLAVTENYLKETFAVPLEIIGSS